MANEILLSVDGYQKIKRELEDLKGPVRARIADAIREAKSHGDLKENAAYHEAKLNQQRLESRISDLERALELAKIVERPDGASDMAHLGSRVKVIDIEFDEEIVIELVGSFEADPTQDRVSITSPLGAALLGKVSGEDITFETPGGTQYYRIVAIEQIG